MQSDEQLAAIAAEAYTYLYPLITMEITRLQLTNVEPGSGVVGAPMNQLAHVREFPDANFKAVVRPNFDTLYSASFLDLTDGPVVLSAPDTDGRYYLLPLLDMWTDVFAVPGARTSGTGPGHWAVVPRGWSGELPAGVEQIDAPTPYVWLIGRTQTNGPADYEAVHAVQDGFAITPLSQWGSSPESIEATVDPDVDMNTPPLDQVNALSGVDFFSLGAELMKLHAPHVSDWAQVRRMRELGLVPGESFDPTALAASTIERIEATPAAAQKALLSALPHIAAIVNGWQMNTSTIGVYGNFYAKRAIVAMLGLGANPPEDAIYPLLMVDADGDPVDGSRDYVLHFDAAELPPVGAFWSLTMYDGQGFQVPNELDRFAIGDRDQLQFGADGSLDLYVQRANPGPERVANWLPAAAGPSGLTMRLYAPRTTALDGTWAPPPLRKA